MRTSQDRGSAPLARIAATLSAICLVFAVAWYLLTYPLTHSQPDFGYGFGVIMLVMGVGAFTIYGLALAVLGLLAGKGLRFLLWLLVALNPCALVTVIVAFKWFYAGNEPLY